MCVLDRQTDGVFVGVCFSGTKDRTQDFVYTKQALYHLAVFLALLFCFLK